MYMITTEIKDSPIDGKGVFSLETIPKSKIVWLFKEGHDVRKTKKEFDSLSDSDKGRLEKTAYLSPWSGLWVYPPDGDPAEFTNHSPKNNLSVKFNADVSPEPYFVANRDITVGEELTNNYHEFDEITRSTKPAWAD
jgi:SET domain-containing protein